MNFGKFYCVVNIIKKLFYMEINFQVLSRKVIIFCFFYFKLLSIFCLMDFVLYRFIRILVMLIDLGIVLLKVIFGGQNDYFMWVKLEEKIREDFWYCVIVVIN